MRIRWFVAVIVAAVLAQAWIPVLADLDVMGALSGALGGFAVGLVVTIFFGFAFGWNRRGDYEQDQAIEGIKKKNAGNRI